MAARACGSPPNQGRPPSGREAAGGEPAEGAARAGAAGGLRPLCGPGPREARPSTCRRRDSCEELGSGPQITPRKTFLYKKEGRPADGSHFANPNFVTITLKMSLLGPAEGRND